TSRLRVSHAFHSPLMEPMLDAFRAVAEQITYATPTIPVVSNLTGRLAAEGELTSAAYWVRHVREAVRFADGVRALAAQGVTRFLEIGPDSTLTALAQNCLLDDDAAVFASFLRKDRDEVDTFVSCVAAGHTSGVPVDWAAVTGPGPTTGVDLPTYAFQRERFWPQTKRIGAAPGLDTWEPAGAEEARELAGVLDISEDVVQEVLSGFSARRRERTAQAAVDGWRYRIDWEPVTVATGTARTGRWLLLHPEGDAALLDTVTTALSDPLLLPLPQHPDRSDLAAAVTAAVATSRTPVAGAVVLPGTVAQALVATQALGDAGLGGPVWWITRGAVTLGRPADGTVRPERSAVWGLGRVAALEHPERWGGLVDLPETSSDSDSDTARLLADIVASSTEDQVAVRDGRLFARRLRQAPAPRGTGQGWKPAGPVLVTGGTGALGAHVARWLVRQGADELVLTSRRGETADGATALSAELRASGARQVSVEACDLADRDAVAALLARHRVDAVFHVAGVPDHMPFGDIDTAHLERTMGAKAHGAGYLDELTRDQDLSAFVVFSSIAAVWGSGSQGAYAAANAWADAVVEDRLAAGRTGLSVQWGPWAGGGMVSSAGAAELERHGLRVMDPERALLGLTSALEGPGGAVVVADLDRERFVPAFTVRRDSPLLGGLPGITPTAPEATGGNDAADARAALVARLGNRPEKERRRALHELVRTRAGAVLGRATGSAVDLDRSFRDIGFDSLTAVELRNELHAATGLRLPTTLVFDHPTPRHLADRLHEELFADAGAAHGDDETSLRSALAKIPFSRWQESGLLTAVLSLAQTGADSGPADDAVSDPTGPTVYGTARVNTRSDGTSAPDAIGAMDVDALVQLALGDSTS
ncbi:type I polyketide synthase, partial [Streptomyces sp. NPDC006552]|uniref:type I polyketide synthase n=1 Tax=Streptomyces sp. NPDC006552 TaxID=3157179 RepID=UPI0033AD1915